MLWQHTIALDFLPQSRDLETYRLVQFTCTSQIRTESSLYCGPVQGTSQVSIAQSSAMHRDFQIRRPQLFSLESLFPRDNRHTSGLETYSRSGPSRPSVLSDPLFVQ
jgi:hypothetical protein